MKTKTLSIILLLINFNTVFAQFVEVPTPVNNALYSGCAVQGSSYSCHIWVCGAGGVVFKGRVNVITLNWLNVSGNLPNGINLFTIAAIDSLTAFVGGNISSTAYIYKTTNGGVNWQLRFSQTSGRINAVWMRNALTGFAQGNPVGGRWSLWRTTNGGANWDSAGRYLSASSGETGFNNSLWCIGDTVIFGTNNSRTYFSSNHGLSWIAQSTTPEINIHSIYWDFYPYPSTQMFAGSLGSFLHSSNYGMNWIVQQNVPGTGNITGICSYTPGVYSTYEYYDIYTRSNKIYEGQFIYGSWSQMYSAPAGNYTFLFQKRNEPPPPYQWFSPLVGIRDNGGVSICFTCRWGGIRRLETEVPVEYSLFQNYPNPFNPATKIKFDIPSAPLSFGEGPGVRLVIYDVLGREVATLVNEQLQPGTYEVEWDGSNYPSGVYFYKLIVSDASAPLSISYTETKKMVLIK